MIIYCCIGGLSTLKYEFTQREREEYIQFIYQHYLGTGEGFRGSMTHKLPKETRYDPPTIANTYCALCILLMLGEDFSDKIDRHAIMSYIKKCQAADGSFKSIVDIYEQPFGDGDLRQTYMTCCIRKMLKYDELKNNENDIKIDAIIQNIQSQITFDGGIGIGESHAGYTYCALATLKLLEKLDQQDDKWEKTLDWLAHRQLSFNAYNESMREYENADVIDHGAHNGRDNKFGDTCYSYWCGASLNLLHSESFIDGEANEKYLLQVTQNSIMGGFAKSDADDPDPYHSFLGLAALTIIDSERINEQLEPIDPILSIPQTSAKFMNSIRWE